jgi:hypothetical protein
MRGTPNDLVAHTTTDGSLPSLDPVLGPCGRGGNDLTPPPLRLQDLKAALVRRVTFLVRHRSEDRRVDESSSSFRGAHVGRCLHERTSDWEADWGHEEV